MPINMILAAISAVLLIALIATAIRLAFVRRDLVQVKVDLAAGSVLAARVPDLEAEVDTIRLQRDKMVRENANLQIRLTGIEEAHAARIADLKGMQKDLEDKFASLAGGVLQSNSESFLKLVSERFEKHNSAAAEDLEKRQIAIRNLVEPLNGKLTQFDQKISEIEKARSEAYGAIQQQVVHLSEGQLALGQETRRLVQALRAPKTRGRWGEMQLRQVFEMAGMTEHVDFHLEAHLDTDDGARRPDAIVHIPGGKNIVVDAKTPLEAYLDAIEADTSEAREEQLLRHAGHVREHVKLLASKAYQEAIATTPDFVVMFIPGESFVSAAAEADSGLMEFALRNKVMIAGPTTLMSLVKAIAYGWQQEKMAENAADVQKAAKELYDRLATFASLLNGVGKSLNSSVSAYNKAVGSLERRVLPSARRFEGMGVVAAGNELAGPRMIESDTRPVTAPEADGTADAEG